jgi:hypothetical protein
VQALNPDNQPKLDAKFSELTTPKPKPAAPYITGLKREKIVQALAVGHSARFVAKTNGHGQSTVRAISQADRVQIDAAKEKLAVQAADIAKLAGNRIKQNLRKNTLPVHLLPTTFGIAVDKMLALRGEGDRDRGLTINLLNLTGGSA